MRRKVKAVITAVTGDLVVVTEDQFEHARAHFVGMPPMLFLELLTILSILSSTASSTSMKPLIIF
ncbi:MAG: hypothetical protein NTY08_15460 [Proteobacteria bacterium]|nr:hypothetical protein [Pseudomonadota bacterium]